MILKPKKMIDSMEAVNNTNLTPGTSTSVPIHSDGDEPVQLLQLPPELLVEILRGLTPEEVITITAVNRTFNELGNDHILWKKLFEAPPFVKYPFEEGMVSAINSKENYKQFVMNGVAEKISDVYASFTPLIINSFFEDEDHFAEVTTPLIHNGPPDKVRLLDDFRTSIFPEGKSIVIGKDQFERPFISLKLRVTYNNADEIIKKDFVIIFFQRRDKDDMWCSWTRNNRDFANATFYCEFKLADISVANDKELKNVVSIIQGNTLEITEFARPEIEMFQISLA